MSIMSLNRSSIWAYFKRYRRWGRGSKICSLWCKILKSKNQRFYKIVAQHVKSRLVKLVFHILCHLTSKKLHFSSGSCSCIQEISGWCPIYLSPCHLLGRPMESWTPGLCLVHPLALQHCVWGVKQQMGRFFFLLLLFFYGGFQIKKK